MLPHFVGRFLTLVTNIKPARDSSSEANTAFLLKLQYGKYSKLAHIVREEVSASPWPIFFRLVILFWSEAMLLILLFFYLLGKPSQ